MNIIRDAGWKNYGDAAFAIVDALFDHSDALISDEALAHVLPDVFCSANKIDARDLREALAQEAPDLLRLIDLSNSILDRALIQIGDIDSFAEVSNIQAPQVATYSSPLKLSEDEVEQIIAHIVGEPYRQKDWGGELDDMFSAQVRLGGREVTASFMLKGPGLRAKTMKPKDLGKNGDQITRLTKQPAELFIVQFVGGIDPSVYSQLENAIITRRARGQPHVVGSVWNGVDTARLGVAYGFLDPATGALRQDRLQAQ